MSCFDVKRIYYYVNTIIKMINSTNYLKCQLASQLKLFHYFAKRAVHMGRIVPELEPDLSEKIADKSVHPKSVRTRRNFGFVSLPAQLHAIAEERLSRYADKAFRKEAKMLINIMYKIKLPDDEDTLKLKRADVKAELEIRDKIKQPPADADGSTLAEDELMLGRELSKLIQGIVQERRRDWHYFEYDERAALMYMATRLAPNYACLKTVMQEIHNLDPSFKPNSVLDFGSGMGTTIWAVNETWPNQTGEFVNIDISKDQQYLCEYLLRGGKDIGDSPPGVYHRQYLPSSNRVKYDLVVAAFSMLELPNREVRANTIENLWNKTNDLLVIIERGNRGGFATVNEARNFVLDMSGHDVTKKLNLSPSSKPILRREMPTAHVLAPCSHEFICPRAVMGTKNNMDVCRFKVHLEPIAIGAQKPATQPEEFSYVVLRKRPHDSYLHNDCPIRWPRIVEKPKRGGGHIIQKLCCPNGGLAETVITAKKYGKPLYEIAKASSWGDILPIKVNDTYEVKNSKRIKKD